MRVDVSWYAEAGGTGGWGPARLAQGGGALQVFCAGPCFCFCFAGQSILSSSINDKEEATANEL